MSQAQLLDPDEPTIAYCVSIPNGDIRERALDLAMDINNLRGSIEDGAGSFAGIVAELLFVDIVGGVRDADYNHDVTVSGCEIDLKTKRRTVSPEPHYEVSIADFNTEQDCDLYYFTSVDVDAEELWFCGALSPSEYYERATFHEAGETDPDNDFVFKDDCYNVSLSELRQPSWIIDTLAGEACNMRVTDPPQGGVDG